MLNGCGLPPMTNIRESEWDAYQCSVGFCLSFLQTLATLSHLQTMDYMQQTVKNICGEFTLCILPLCCFSAPDKVMCMLLTFGSKIQIKFCLIWLTSFSKIFIHFSSTTQSYYLWLVWQTLKLSQVRLIKCSYYFNANRV